MNKIERAVKLKKVNGFYGKLVKKDGCYNMSAYLAFPIGIVIITFVSLFLYRFGRNKSNKILKYIPSILSALSIALVYLKMTYISQGYQPIIDIIIMIILSFVFGISLLVAVLMDIMIRRNKN